ncbi:MAG: HAD family hydrolase [Desulfosoma sp.]
MEKTVFFFDIGHTLVTGAEASPRRLLGAALKLDEHETKTVGKLLMTLPAADPETVGRAVSAVLPRHDPAMVFREIRRLWDDQMECVREIPGATALVSLLKEAGHGIGLISNIWHPFFLGFQKRCPDIDASADFRFLSYREGVKKPAEALFEKAVQAARMRGFGQCWMVGDSYELDIEPARASGMRGLWILHRPERERDLLADILNGMKPAPEGSVANLADVVGFLKKRGLL